MKSRNVTIDFDLGKHGWGSCLVSVGKAEFLLSSISYTTDALGDLLRAAVEVAVGGRKAICSFDREPHEWRLILRRTWDHPTGGDIFTIEVREFEDIYRIEPDAAGFVAFSATCEAEDFVHAVHDAVQNLLTNNGRERYLAWNSPFPDRAFAALKATLGLPPEY